MSEPAPRYSAEEAMEKLLEGNREYVRTGLHSAEIGEDVRLHTASKGQFPYAVIITCSDSRVIPTAAFNAGIGDLFIIRSAGNIVDGCTLGSVEYAVEHLGCRLVVVLGHTHCGAIKSTLEGPQTGPVAFITEEIRAHIRENATPMEACIDNVNHAISKLENELPKRADVKYAGAMYDIEKGTVEFL